MYPESGDSNGALESSKKAQAILEVVSREEPENQEVRRALAAPISRSAMCSIFQAIPPAHSIILAKR